MTAGLPKRKVLKAVVFLTLGLVAGFSWGSLATHYKFFPYAWLSNLKDIADPPDERSQTQVREDMFEAFSPDVDIVFVGDSIFARLEVSDIFPDWSVANRAIGGQGFAELARRRNAINALNAEVVVVHAGINDAGRPIENVLADFETLLGALEDSHAQLVILSTLECRDCPRRDFVQRLNPRLEVITQDRGHVWLDVNASMTDDSGLRRYFTNDGIHLDVGGAEAFRDALLPVFHTYLAAGDAPD